MAELQILVVEDDRLLRKAVYDRLCHGGHHVQACECLLEARGFLEKNDFDLAFLDMRLPDGDGLEFLAEVKEHYPRVESVIMTAFADVRTAVAAIKRGAFDYLPKPFEDEQLEKIVRNACSKIDLSNRVSTLSRLAVENFDNVWRFDNMIGTEALGKVFETAQRIAQSPDTTVLILGESGTGKGMLAKAIHRLSPRADKPFVDINCSAIPEQLMESEIFGYEKGAFTDAKVKKPGLLEVANGGSVFLDEIGDMDMNLQGKILKVIEDKEFRRLGGARTTRVDIRIIAATNRDLKARVREGKFREDLYYRLSVIPVVIPPLREHKKSIEPLASHYTQVFSKQMGRKNSRLGPSAMKALMGYAWPGNIRELRNVIERGMLLCTGEEIGLEDLRLTDTQDLASDEARQGPDGVSIMSLAESEKRLIKAVLESVDGNKNKAADILKIHRTTLYKKLEEYKLG
ncbi:MAG: sigma-54 dependent transcriptional regulator [Lentisphaerota bacterium]